VFFAVLGVVIVMWNEQLAAPTVVGEVESISANIIATKSGLLSELNVERFQKVAKGQLVGRVIITESEILQASLTAIEQDLKVLRARMDQDQRRTEVNYEQLRQAWMSRRVELAIARVNLQYAEAEFQRIAQLFQDQLVSQDVYDLAFRAQGRLRVEVTEQEKLVADVEQGLNRLESSGREAATLRAVGVTSGPEADPAHDPISAAIAAQEAKLSLIEGPVVLTVPLDGRVSMIYHRPGEKIMAGDPIATITALNSDRIVGYVRQPLTVVPKVGDEVQVRTRGSARKTATGRVLQVGSQMQMVASPLHIRGYDTSQERGLPFLVELPPGLHAYPGELVDLVFRK